ncbi:ERF superfamily protein (plasmid) [Borrelia nietonii YOR]|uniref:ERF superfamily protein n=1 Tax=Borrelia nietonii YOR TaxID=1293576 RepID=W5SBY3_9SPIR|nr:ERF superfamily protein [Borrelia nietonii YOR]
MEHVQEANQEQANSVSVLLVKSLKKVKVLILKQ